jgi:hypothetical protein
VTVTEVHPLFGVALNSLGPGPNGFILLPDGRDTLEQALSTLCGADLKEAVSALAMLAHLLRDKGSAAASKGILAVTEAALARPPARELYR